jgi:urease accessory protein
MQRSRGEAMVSLGFRAGVVRIGVLRQKGSAKVILPHCGEDPEAVFLNTSGGLTGGDSLSYAVDLGEGVAATATTQTAERAYRSTSGLARVTVDLTVGRNGWIDWLPQETILFDQAKLDRRTQVSLGPNAGCLLLETIVLGRAAMGETVSTVLLRDWRDVRRDGVPLMVEPLSLTQNTLTSGVAGLDGARAFASLVMIAPDAADFLDPVRNLLTEPGVQGAASALEGRLMLRLMASDGWPLRRQIARCLGLLRRGRPLPRVWQM